MSTLEEDESGESGEGANGASGGLDESLRCEFCGTIVAAKDACGSCPFYGR